MTTEKNVRLPALGIIAATATVAFGFLARVERDRRLVQEDKKALNKIAARSKKKHRRAAALLDPFGKWWFYTPLSVAAAAAVYAKGSGGQRVRIAAAAALGLAAGIGAGVNPLFDRLLPQPPTPPGRKSKPKPSFPSGHTLGLGAVALAIAYILEREELIPLAMTAPIALLPPTVGGLARIIEQKHWPSEVGGGALVAIAIASLSAMVYEAERGRECVGGAAA